MKQNQGCMTTYHLNISFRYYLLGVVFLKTTRIQGKDGIDAEESREQC